MERIAIVAITKNGVEISRKLQRGIPKAHVYYPKKFQTGDEDEVHTFLISDNLKVLLAELFQTYKAIVMVIALGAVVRLIAPFIKDKKTDPAIVVIDEKGTFAISVLSGHIGGGNKLTKLVAEIVRATPVITTASDVQNTLQVDLFGNEWGWKIDRFDDVTRLSASVVNGEKVVIVQESGEKGWQPLASNIQQASSVEEALKMSPKGILFISHRKLQLPIPNVSYRPKVICLGIGCNRGTNMVEIEKVIIDTLEELAFSIDSVKGICSIDLKKDEKGLLELAKKHGWEMRFFEARELNKVKITAPSETVLKYTGAYGVSEPAAMLYSGASKLEVVKKKSGNVTISVAIIEE